MMILDMGSLGTKPVVDELVVNRQSPMPLFEQIVEQFRGLIRSGQLVPGEPFPTNREVMSALDVNYKTVHRAIATLASEGYVSRRRGKGTFVQLAPKVGVVGIRCPFEVFEPVRSSFYSQMVRCLALQLQAQGRNHRVYFASNPDDSSNASQTDLTNDLKKGALAGLLLLDNNPDVKGILELAAARHIPVITLASAGDAPLSVSIDRRGYLRAAAEHLMNLGRRRVAVIFNTLSCSEIRDERLIRETLNEAGLVIVEGAIIGRPAGVVGGYDAAQSLPLGQVDGLIITDDVMAMGVDRLLTQLSVRVPDELAVTTLWSQGSELHPHLPFDRFEIDLEEMGRSSLRLLNEASSGRRIAEPHLWSRPRLCNLDTETEASDAALGTHAPGLEVASERHLSRRWMQREIS